MVKDNPHAPPVLRWIVEFRGVEKVIGTYLSGMANNPDENDQLRPTPNACCRWSSC